MLQQVEQICQDMENFSPPLSYIKQQLGYELYHKAVIQHKIRTGQFEQVWLELQIVLVHRSSSNM